MTRAADVLVLHGGSPVRETPLPYGRQSVQDDDLAAVEEVLRSDWLTTGPKVAEFEEALAGVAGTDAAVAVSNGTAALHAAMFAIGIGPGDEVIVPAITFASTANAVLFQGGTPVFADVEADTLMLDPKDAERKITARTRAIVSVDYAGQPCDYGALREIAERRRVALVSDACHALGGEFRGRPVGSLADLSAFSFHPVKHITSGEGGAVTTDDRRLAEKMRAFRNHGITSDHRQRQEKGTHSYEMEDLGYNYRLTDFQCAMAASQLRRLPGFVQRRQAIAAAYNEAFSGMSGLSPLAVRPNVSHAYHLYVVQLDLDALTTDRDTVFSALRAENVGVNVHYLPVYWHPYYERLGYKKGSCPTAERAYEQIISLPMFYDMTDEDVDDVMTAVRKVVGHYAL